MSSFVNDAPQELLDFLLIGRGQKAKINGFPVSRFSNEHIIGMLSVLDPDMPYSDWIDIGMILHADNRDVSLWIDWSSKSLNKFKPGECQKKWRSFGKRSGLNIGTLVMMAEAKGWVSPYKKIPSSNHNQRPETGHIQLLDWSDLDKLPPKQYLVKGLIDRNGFSVVYGESNSGKTFVAVDIALHIALGWEWHGRNTREGSIVYIASEGGSSIKDRLASFKMHHKLETRANNIYFLTETVPLNKESSILDELIQEIKSKNNVQLIIIDTLARAMGEGDENSSVDMGAFIKNCDLIRRETGGHLMAIHHSGKDKTKEARGHSSLKAAIDTEIKVSQDNGIISVKVTKQRDGEKGTIIDFKLEKYEVRKDEDDDPIYSCALIKDTLSLKNGLAGQTLEIFQLITELINSQGVIISPKKGISEKRCIDVAILKENIRARRIADSDKPDTINRAYRRTREILVGGNYIEEHKGYIWLPDK